MHEKGADKTVYQVYMPVEEWQRLKRLEENVKATIKNMKETTYEKQDYTFDDVVELLESLYDETTD